MILVDDVLLSDIAKKNKQIGRLAARKGLEGQHDASMNDLFSKGVDKASILKDISKFSEVKQDEDLL